MIYINDYRRPLGLIGERMADDERPGGMTDYLGHAVAVRTTAGVYAGIMVADSPYAITLAMTRRQSADHRKILISKAHIVAIETRLR